MDQSTGQAIMQEVHDYYEENSYGQLDMVSTVFPTLSLPITVECSSSDFATIAAAVEAAAANSGINIDAFDSVIMIGPGYGDCVGLGLGTVGGSAPEYALVRPNTNYGPPLDWASLISHELGHHLGLVYADMIDQDRSRLILGREGNERHRALTGSGNARFRSRLRVDDGAPRRPFGSHDLDGIDKELRSGAMARDLSRRAGGPTPHLAGVGEDEM